MNYTTPAGRIFDIKEVLDTPFWSRKQAPSAAGQKVKFFDESGAPSADSNMVAAGQFSNSQTFICRQIQLDLSLDNASAFSAVGSINDIAQIIHGSIIILDKNRGQDWQCHFNKMLVTPTVNIAATAGWSSIDKSIQGRYIFNEPIIFGPGETFTFTTEYTGSVNLSALNVLFTFMGFLGIEKVVTST